MCTKAVLGMTGCGPNESRRSSSYWHAGISQLQLSLQAQKNNLILLCALILILYAVYTDATCGVLPIFGFI